MNNELPKGADSGRQNLIDFTNLYLDCMLKHDYARLPVAENLRVTQNGVETRLGEDIWKTATDITYRQYFIDGGLQQVLFFGVVGEDGVLANLMLRLKLTEGRLEEAETILCRKGQSSVFNPESLVTPNPIFDRIIARSERSGTRKMIAIANSYFDGVERHNGDNVPLHPDCNRIENGVQTTNRAPFNFNCAEGLKRLLHITRVRDRRYLIADEERGIVGGVFTFDAPGISGGNVNSVLPPSMLVKRSIIIGEIFKIIDGQIREIEALMVNIPFGAASGWENGAK
jgi:hypothetical protein